MPQTATPTPPTAGAAPAGGVTLDEQFFVRIALKNGLLARDAAAEGLKLQRDLAGRGARKPIEAILLDLGHLTPSAVDRIRDAQRATQTLRLDTLYADIARKLGLVDAPLLDAALAEQRAGGFKRRLSEILLDGSMVSLQNHSKILRELHQSIKSDEQAYIALLRGRPKLGSGSRDMRLASTQDKDDGPRPAPPPLDKGSAPEPGEKKTAMLAVPDMAAGDGGKGASGDDEDWLGQSSVASAPAPGAAEDADVLFKSAVATLEEIDSPGRQAALKEKDLRALAEALAQVDAAPPPDVGAPAPAAAAEPGAPVSGDAAKSGEKAEAAADAKPADGADKPAAAPSRSKAGLVAIVVLLFLNGGAIGGLWYRHVRGVDLRPYLSFMAAKRPGASGPATPAPEPSGSAAAPAAPAVPAPTAFDVATSAAPSPGPTPAPRPQPLAPPVVDPTAESAAARAAAASKAFNKLFNEGQFQEQRGSYGEAIKLYNEALAAAEGSRKALVSLRIKACEAKLAKATDPWTEAIEGLKKGHYDEALAALDALVATRADERADRVRGFVRGLRDMVYVPAGKFAMGSPADDLPAARPAHEAQTGAYFVDRYEVRNIEYSAFLIADGGAPPDHWAQTGGSPKADQGDHPVVNVTFADAERFAKWRGKRLPTEAEWEKAARGTEGRAFPWGDLPVSARPHVLAGPPPPDPTAVFTRAVGASDGDVSPFGAYDMGGNVAEWTASPFVAYPGPRTPAGGTPAFDDKSRVLRGGSWLKDTMHARAARRQGLPPAQKARDLGFRCVKDVPDWLPELR